MKLPQFISKFYRTFVEAGLQLFTTLSKDDSHKKKEKELEHFANIGYITAALEHDLRNPLSVIQYELMHLEREFSNNPKLYPIIEHLKEEVLRINTAISLVSMLRMDSVGSSSVLELDSLVNKAIKLTKAELNVDANKLFFKFESERKVLIKGSPKMLVHALINILKNSVEAQKCLGVVKIQVSIDKLAQEVAIRVIDSGCGIENRFLSKLTISSFSTKTTGGHGVGLFLANKIVKMHDGKLTIESKVGKGTIVSILLPIYLREKQLNEKKENTDN